MLEFLRDQQGWPAALIGLAVTAGLALLAHLVLVQVGRRLASRTKAGWDDSLIRHGAAPSRLLAVVLAWHFGLPLADLSPPLQVFAGQVLAALLIVAVAWLSIRLTAVFQDVLTARYDVTAADNLQARKIHTQFRIVRRIVTAGIIVLAAGCILMSFEQVRQLGTGILASAGILGIVVGLAAQRSLATLFAGLQIALTQPIRLDDVVIVEGEWGRIEEITLTYVVVRIWDLRRLVLPITYFLEKPFQNWTRVSADLLGTVFLQVDYRVPVESLRAELKRILEGSEQWDGEVCAVQVTDARERTLELRALMSAADASRLWELRCLVRERLVAFVTEHHPATLPRLRAELDAPVDSAVARAGRA